jgi:hypothetical protein
MRARRFEIAPTFLIGYGRCAIGELALIDNRNFTLVFSCF